MTAASSSAPAPHLPPAAPIRRYLALWLPFLALEAHPRRASLTGGPDNAPSALYERAGGALRLAALDLAALQLGLRRRMPLADARAVVPGLRVDEIDPDAAGVRLAAAASACERFTPLVALDRGDGLLLDITGCAHLFGGEQGLAIKVRALFARGRLSSRIAVASTPDAARAFARFGRQAIVPPGEERPRAAALPVAALECSEATEIALGRAGLRSLGDLAERPSSALAARFGADIATRLTRILGGEDIRIAPLRAAPECMAERPFAEPVTALENVMIALERLATALAASLEARGRGGRCFEASFFRSDGVTRRITVETARPTRDVASLMRLIKLRADALDDPLNPGYGFDMLRLAVLRSEAAQAGEPEFDRPDPEGEGQSLADLVGGLVARFGRDSVRRLVGRDTHDPVREGASLPYLSGVEAAPLLAPWPAPEEGHPPARPLSLFDHPQPVEAIAEVPDGPPLRFRWRKVLHEVARAEGPERIAPEWWRASPPPPTRDYYRIEDAEGRRFWLYREGLFGETGSPPRWYVHGLFA